MLARATKEVEEGGREGRGGETKLQNKWREAAGCHCSQEAVLSRDNEQKKREKKKRLLKGICI